MFLIWDDAVDGSEIRPTIWDAAKSLKDWDKVTINWSAKFQPLNNQTQFRHYTAAFRKKKSSIQSYVHPYFARETPSMKAPQMIFPKRFAKILPKITRNSQAEKALDFFVGTHHRWHGHFARATQVERLLRFFWFDFFWWTKNNQRITKKITYQDLDFFACGDFSWKTMGMFWTWDVWIIFKLRTDITW